MMDDLSFDPAYEEWRHYSTHALCARPPKRSVAELKALIDRVLGVAPGTPWGQHEQEQREAA